MLLAVGLALGAWALGLQMSKGDTKGGVEVVSAHAATVYKSPTCGCCSNYVAYLRRYGLDVEVVETEDMGAIKQTHGIPAHMESCHTTVFDDGQVAEGHIPMEAIEQMMKDHTVETIAMPGMPAGSPGMPGAKRGAFMIHHVTEMGVSEFMQL